MRLQENRKAILEQKLKIAQAKMRYLPAGLKYKMQRSGW